MCSNCSIKAVIPRIDITYLYLFHCAYSRFKTMGFLEDVDTSTLPSIPEYYTAKTIFMTGGSGFMGKVLIEKLLYSCTNLKKIYLLLRSKKGMSPEDRLNALYSSPCFDRLRKERPGVYEAKMALIAGDISELGLGITEEDRTKIINETNVIFHVAASVRFDDTVKSAVLLNLRGTKEVIDLAREVKNLEALVHVSTSYLNTIRDSIEEVMYPPYADWREVINICENTDEQTLQVLTSKFLGILPNTYVFAKQMAEHMIYEERGKLPVVIIRPSVVVGSVVEPVPGWIESFNGPNGICVGVGKGILRVLYCRTGSALDYVPVDWAIRHFILASWLRGTRKVQTTDDIPIYHCCSGDLIKITIQEVVETGLANQMHCPLDNALWAINCTVTSSKFMFQFWFLFLNLLPALFVDSLLLICGKSPLLMKVQRKIYVANMALEYFINQRWNFSNKNFVNMRSAIKPEDIDQFYYDLEGLDVTQYFQTAFSGGRKFLMKEKEEDIPKARAHLRRVTILDRTLKVLFFGFIVWKIFQMNIIGCTITYLCSFLFG